jgi:hypothetical protein
MKKIFSSFVALTTIAWSVTAGTLALPSVASAATLMNGDLIKASGPAVYYYAADGRRYVFPNEKTYFSWYYDFSSVKTITDEELAALTIGGNVTIRPGTKLVKITTDPKVYAVTQGGVLHWVESEAIAITLFGAGWAQRVVDVPDGFFVNYSVGSSLSTAVHPDGSLIQYAGDPARYVVWGGMKRLIASDAAFAANGFQSVHVLTTTVSYPNGTDVTGRESALADVIMGGGSTPVSGNLSVALASDTPAGATVPKNASSVMLAKYNLTAGSNAVTVTGLRLHRVGVGATSDFSNVYLYDANGTRLTTGRTVNSSTNNVEFNSLNVMIGAGQTISLVMVADFGSPASTGGQHSFEILDAASVVISGTGTVSGSFPVRGNVFTVGTTSSARLDVQKGTTPANPNIGAAEAEISNFKLTANTNDIEVRRITLLQAGSVSNSDLSDLKLYQGSTLVASAATLTGDKIVLTFSPAYVITNGTTKTFSLKAKIAGRADRTIKTYVEYTTDVYAIDRTYNAGAAVCIASTAVGGCTSTGQGTFDGSSTNYIEITTQGGQLTVTFNGPATSNVAKGQQDVVLYKFALASPDNVLEIRNLDFKILGQDVGGGPDAKVKGSAGTDYFRDIKIKNLDTGATVMGPTSLSTSLANNASDSGIITLSDAFNIQAGQILNLAITADLSNSEDSTDFFNSGTSTYKVILGDGSNLFGSSDVRIVNTGEFLSTAKIVPNSTINGNNFTVKASSLSVALASSPSASTVVKKQGMIPAAGFVFTAGAQSVVTIKSVKLTGRGNLSGSYAVADLDDVVTQCALFDETGAQQGISASPDTTLGTVNITNMNVLIPSGTSKTLTAKCTADSVISGTEDLFAIGILTASTDVTAEDGDSNSVTASLSSQITGNAGASPTLAQTVKNSGTLSLATENLRSSTILVGGGDVWQNLAQFKATAQFEDMNIERVAVTSTGEAANFTAIAVAKDGAVKGWDILSSGAYSSKDIDLSASPIIVPKDGSASFQLWGKLANVVSSSSVSGATAAPRSGNTFALGIAAGVQTGEWDSNYDNQYNLRATGAASGERVYATSTTDLTGTSGNTFVLRKTKPTVTRQALSTTTLSSGTMDLYKFQVSADSAGAVALKKFAFSYSKNAGSYTLSSFRLRRGSSDMALSDIAIVSDSITGNEDLEAGVGLAAASTTGQIVVSFTNEETISGSGNVYTLYATIGGSVAASDTISFSFVRVGNTTVVTGFLEDDIVSGEKAPNIDTATNPDGTADVKGTFLWSDQSEVPHSSVVGVTSSRDWTNDVYVEDLTQTQVLSR